MEHIVATTDLSENSVAGMRFAMHLAKARNAKLTFLFVDHVLRASTWTDSEYDHYIEKSREANLKDLEPFVRSLVEKEEGGPFRYEIVVHYNLDTTEGILEYAYNNHCAYVCISTRGAGKLKKIIGTNTGRLISSSEIPVVCVPVHYPVSPVSHLLYACDMADVDHELKQVVTFARPIQAKINLTHFSYTTDLHPDNTELAQKLNRQTGYDIDLNIKQRNVEHSLLQEIENTIQHTKPSLLVMFTNQDRGFFDRLFLSSKTQEYSFNASIPMLIFKKRNVS